MTRSEVLIAKVREAAHKDRHERGEGTELQCAALEIAQEYEILISQTLSVEKELHRLIKKTEAI